MEYRKIVNLKDGRACILRNAVPQDAPAVLENFILTHGQTDFLTSRPDEIHFTLEQEESFLQKKAESPFDAELLALVDGKLAGTAGIDRIGAYDKVRHRASFGISIDQAYWGLGIGRALLNACIECAKSAGYTQLELDAVADNKRAIALYESAGFTEYGRNPRGFLSRVSGFQPLVLMRLELDAAPVREP